MNKLILAILLLIASVNADGLICKLSDGGEVWYEDYDDVVVVWRIYWGQNTQKEVLAYLPYGEKVDANRYCLLTK